MMTFEIESITEIVRSKLAAEPDAEKKQAVYNAFNLGYVESCNHLLRHHEKQLGHASVMSWRMYLENMWWFGMIVPMYVGKWHLDLQFLRKFRKQTRGVVRTLMVHVYEQFNQLIEQDANIGLMHIHRGNQLPFGYYITKEFDSYLQDTKYEPKKCNVYAYMKNIYFFVALWYIKFLWKGFGIAGLLSPRNLYHVFNLLKASVECALDDLIFKFQSRGVPPSTTIANMTEEFQSYQYLTELQPWIQKVAEPSLQSNAENTAKVAELIH